MSIIVAPAAFSPDREHAILQRTVVVIASGKRREREGTRHRRFKRGLRDASCQGVIADEGAAVGVDTAFDDRLAVVGVVVVEALEWPRLDP